MHLKSLRLKNFKSHSDTSIEFGQITSIIGRNCSGKTNILRALKILLHHEDWPVSWIRYGQDTATIELTLTDGTIVTRKRSKSTQSVTINKSGKIEVFEGKKEATQYIEKAIGIKKVTLDEVTGPEDLNFVEVNEGPYLIGGRADTVQRKVSGIVGANKIDDARSRILKNVKELETQSARLGTEISRLAPIVNSSHTSLESIQNILSQATKLNQHREENESKLQVLYDCVEHLNNITSLIPTTNVAKYITLLYQEVVKIKSSLSDNILGIQFTTQLNSSFKSNYISKEFDMTKDLYNGIISLRDQLLSTSKKLSTIGQFSEVAKIEAYVRDLEIEEQSIAIELEEARKNKNLKLKELGICPVCNRSL